MNNVMRATKSAGAVDFGAITKMIDEMVGVLTAEEADDAKHKVWCQGEFGTTADSVDKATTQAGSLAAAVSENSDEAATLREDIQALKDGIGKLDKEVAEATEQRKSEH